MDIDKEYPVITLQEVMDLKTSHSEDNITIVNLRHISYDNRFGFDYNLYHENNKQSPFLCQYNGMYDSISEYVCKACKDIYLKSLNGDKDLPPKSYNRLSFLK
jgi:hypothetical protein